MKQVNIDIKPIVQLMAGVKMRNEDYNSLKKKPGAAMIMLEKIKRARIKQSVLDERGRGMEVDMSLTDLITHTHNVSWSVARQAVMNMERA